MLEVAEKMCTRVAVINHGKVLAAGTMDSLKESAEESLEDVFIRLVGHSIAEVEGVEDGMTEEE